jgi:bifunctional NMN adenylyltransferase/nudix hydrolase
LEAAARRELLEETHIEVSSLEYVGSFLVDDWRYRNEVDKIMTTVFIARYMFGAIQPDDDIEELRWFQLDRSFDLGRIVSAHRPLLTGTIDAIERGSKKLKEGAIHELPAENR